MTNPNEIFTILNKKYVNKTLLTEYLPTNLACTTNFLWREFVKNQREIPDILVLENIFALAHTLQALRDNIFKMPMLITSAWRSKEYNRQIKGASGSYHIQGMACDIQIRGMSPNAIYEKLSGHAGGLGLYSNFVHIDIGPRRRWKG